MTTDYRRIIDAAKELEAVLRSMVLHASTCRCALCEARGSLRYAVMRTEPLSNWGGQDSVAFGYCGPTLHESQERTKP